MFKQNTLWIYFLRQDLSCFSVQLNTDILQKNNIIRYLFSSFSSLSFFYQSMLKRLSPCHSINTALANVTNDLHKLNLWQILNLSAAFDNVDISLKKGKKLFLGDAEKAGNLVSSTALASFSQTCLLIHSHIFLNCYVSHGSFLSSVLHLDIWSIDIIQLCEMKCTLYIDESSIFILSLDFSLELLAHIFNPLLNILSRYISFSKDQDVIMGIPQTAVVCSV